MLSFTPNRLSSVFPTLPQRALSAPPPLTVHFFELKVVVHVSDQDTASSVVKGVLKLLYAPSPTAAVDPRDAWEKFDVSTSATNVEFVSRLVRKGIFSGDVLLERIFKSGAKNVSLGEYLTLPANGLDGSWCLETLDGTLLRGRCFRDHPRPPAVRIVRRIDFYFDDDSSEEGRSCDM